MATFRRLLLNNLISGVTGSFLWFAVTFWVYLETRSVVTTAVIGATFSIASAFLSPIAGTYVDRHRKHQAMLVGSLGMVGCFVVATGIFLAVDTADLLRLRNPAFWAMVAFTLVGSVAGNMRGIALSTCVTLLVPEDERDRANGMVGTVTGISFAITSVFSGLVVGQLGAGWAFYISTALAVATLAHLHTIHIEEPEPAPAADGAAKHLDVRAAVTAIRAVPGLQMLIALAAFNNLLGGVFMALMDAYGLSMVSVESWGLLFGFVSLSFIGGGLVVARRGLGKMPLKVILAANLANWIVCATFTLQSSVVPLVIGMVVWMGLIPVIEAAEQTVLQRSIPFETQGRVFGFAQMVEQAAAPITAICIGPIAERYVMPYMTDGKGADWIGSWFGIGPDRGLALIFTISGLVGIAVTIAAWASRSYRRLVAQWTAIEAGVPAVA